MFYRSPYTNAYIAESADIPKSTLATKKAAGQRFAALAAGGMHKLSISSLF